MIYHRPSKNRQLLEKIFSSRENLHKYVDTIYRASIKKRFEKYNKPGYTYENENVQALLACSINRIVDQFVDYDWEHLDQNAMCLNLLCGASGTWDEVEHFTRCTAENQFLLALIEPTEEFVRLMGGMLQYLDDQTLDSFDLRKYL